MLSNSISYAILKYGTFIPENNTDALETAADMPRRGAH